MVNHHSIWENSCVCFQPAQANLKLSVMYHVKTCCAFCELGHVVN